MSVVRRVITDTADLRDIADGLIHNPFDKRLHVVPCESIDSMRASKSNPKWHFARADEAEEFLVQHHAKWGGKDWDYAACCRGRKPQPASPSTRKALDSQAAAAATATRAVPAHPAPELRALPAGFEIWTDEYVRNESKAASSAGHLRKQLAERIRQLQPADAQILHAAYAGSRWPGTDVENLLFNNIDQMATLFGRAGANGVRFEDLGQEAPAAPSGMRRNCFYRYGVTDADAPFVGFELGDVVCRVVDAEVEDGTARLASRVWHAVRTARWAPCYAIPAGRPYVLRVKASGLPAAKNLKAIVDGCTAAMQSASQTEALQRSIERLGLLLGRSAAELRDLACSPDAPLGKAKQLFTPDGASQVRVTPDDDRCVGAEIVNVELSGRPRLTVALREARPR